MSWQWHGLTYIPKKKRNLFILVGYFLSASFMFFLLLLDLLCKFRWQILFWSKIYFNNGREYLIAAGSLERGWMGRVAIIEWRFLIKIYLIKYYIKRNWLGNIILYIKWNKLAKNIWLIGSNPTSAKLSLLCFIS